MMNHNRLTHRLRHSSSIQHQGLSPTHGVLISHHWQTLSRVDRIGYEYQSVHEQQPILPLIDSMALSLHRRACPQNPSIVGFRFTHRDHHQNLWGPSGWPMCFPNSFDGTTSHISHKSWPLLDLPIECRFGLSFHELTSCRSCIPFGPSFRHLSNLCRLFLRQFAECGQGECNAFFFAVQMKTLFYMECM
jgi:hypothetical protein